MPQKPIPFHQAVNQGFAEAQGLIHIKKNSLVLEFEVQDAFGGFIKSDLKEIEISFAEIESLVFKKGFWSGKILIEGNSMRTFEDVPGAEQARCTLKIKRKDRSEVEQAISSARVALSEYKLNQLED